MYDLSLICFSELKGSALCIGTQPAAAEHAISPQAVVILPVDLDNRVGLHIPDIGLIAKFLGDGRKGSSKIPAVALQTIITQHVTGGLIFPGVGLEGLLV